MMQRQAHWWRIGAGLAVGGMLALSVSLYHEVVTMRRAVQMQATTMLVMQAQQLHTQIHTTEMWAALRRHACAESATVLPVQTR